MFSWFPYSALASKVLNRAIRLFHDLAAMPPAAERTRRVQMILRAVMRQEIVSRVAARSIEPMTMTPIRDTVRTMARHAAAIAAALSSFSQTGIRELIAATNTGTVVTRNTDKLLESSSVPGTRS